MSGKLITRQIMPGISATNSIAVVQSSKGADVGGFLGKAGLSFSVSLDSSEGFHQAVRKLVDLSTIEVLGKFTHVPYWQCLQIEFHESEFPHRGARMVRHDARQRARQFRPHRHDPYRLLAAGRTSAAGLSAAVARYQADNSLMPTGGWISTCITVCWRRDTRPAAAEPVAAAPPSDRATAAPPPATPPGLVLGTGAAEAQLPGRRNDDPAGAADAR